MIPWRLLDKTCSIVRQVAGAGTVTKSTVATGIRCAAYDGAGWGVGADGGTFTHQVNIYVGDLTGLQIPGRLQVGDFLVVAGIIPKSNQTFTYIVRGTHSWQNEVISRAGVIYQANCEVAPTGQT